MKQILDKKDLQILSELLENSKQTTHQISKKTAIPVTTVHNRIKRMVKEGIIKKFTVEIDYNKIGKPIECVILTTIRYDQPKTDQKKIAKKLLDIGMDEVSIVTGNIDIIAKKRFKNIEEMERFILGKLRNIKGIDKTQTLVVLHKEYTTRL